MNNEYLKKGRSNHPFIFIFKRIVKGHNEHSFIRNEDLCNECCNVINSKMFKTQLFKEK